MPPWYSNPCWRGIILPITPWVSVAWVAVAACALLAGLIANWMTLSNFQDCPAPFAHYKPALALVAREKKLIALVRIALVGLAVGLLLSTALTIALYRRWLRRGATSTSAAPSA